MNGGHYILSDEEYLPLPKQLHPIPVSKWMGPAHPSHSHPTFVGDPALQLTPDKGIRTLQQPDEHRQAPRGDIVSSSSFSKPGSVQIDLAPASNNPFPTTIIDPSLELTPDRGHRPVHHPAKSAESGVDSKVGKCILRNSEHGIPISSISGTIPKQSHNGDSDQAKATTTRKGFSATGENLPRPHGNQKHSKQKATKARESGKKFGPVAWVEKHGDVKSVYNAGNPPKEAAKFETVTASRPTVKGHTRIARRSLDSAREFQVSSKDRGNKEQRGGGKEKERTKLKPILHREGDKRGKAKSNSKKHVTLLVDNSPGLDRPRINSTAVLAARLHDLEDESFDGDGAVVKTLAESDEARATLGERAAVGTNIPDNVSKYQGLISVDIPSRVILEQAVEEKMMRMMVLAPEAEKTKKDPLPSPDVLDVFTPDMIVEYPNLDVSHMTLPPPRLERVPADDAFQLYRRISGWEK